MDLVCIAGFLCTCTLWLFDCDACVVVCRLLWCFVVSGGDVCNLRGVGYYACGCLVVC